MKIAVYRADGFKVGSCSFIRGEKERPDRASNPKLLEKIMTADKFLTLISGKISRIQERLSIATRRIDGEGGTIEQLAYGVRTCCEALTDLWEVVDFEIQNPNFQDDEITQAVDIPKAAIKSLSDLQSRPAAVLVKGVVFEYGDNGTREYYVTVVGEHAFNVVRNNASRYWSIYHSYGESALPMNAPPMLELGETMSSRTSVLYAKGHDEDLEYQLRAVAHFINKRLEVL